MGSERRPRVHCLHVRMERGLGHPHGGAFRNDAETAAGTPTGMQRLTRLAAMVIFHVGRSDGEVLGHDYSPIGGSIRSGITSLRWSWGQSPCERRGPGASIVALKKSTVPG